MAYDPTDPETKAAIDQIKADLNSQHEADVVGIKAKRDELIAEVKTLRRAKDIDPAQVDKLERLEAERDDLTAKLTAAQKQAKDATTAAEKAAKTLESEQKANHRLLVDGGLSDALAKANVKPSMMDYVKSHLAKDVQVVQDGEVRIAKVGEKALADFVSEWSQGDQGKEFILAPVNGGSGAPGGGQGGGADLSKLSPVERITAARAAGAKT